MSDRARHAFWSRTKRLTLALLLVWLVVSVAVPWFARDLHAFRLFGFPLGWWLAAEGALVVYLAIIVGYGLAMDRLEARFLHQVDADAEAAHAEPAAAPGRHDPVGP
jgi:putative solute:sodium symporter small subunit